MSDTMLDMRLVYADKLTPDQLIENDLIKVGDDIVTVKSIDSDATGDNYDVETENEFGETDIVTFNYTTLIPLYVFLDDDDE